jgi:hypothetical protein
VHCPTLRAGVCISYAGRIRRFRIVLNAYFRMGVTGGGFRTWWRELYGSDDNLDDNHLMRMGVRHESGSGDVSLFLYPIPERI